MRIGVDIRCLTEKNYSGISEYTHRLLMELLSLDKKNQYVLFYNKAKKAKIPEIKADNVIIKGFKFPNKFFNLSMGLLGTPKIDKLIGGIDLFWLPNFQFCSFSKNCKTIVTVHDLSFVKYPEFFTAKSIFWHKLINSKLLCQKAARLIAVSENTKNDLIEMYKINSEKIQVIYPGISKKYQPISDHARLREVKNKYQLPDKFILFLGNLEPRKNIASLISAFNLFHDGYHLVIAGAKGWKYENIYQLARSNSQKIKFLGYVQAQDKPALYKLASLFVYPSYYEGFGFPPLEAMACGTPTIVSNTSSLPEVVSDASILADPYDYHDLYQAMSKLLSDNELKNELTKKGIDQAKKFNWQTSAQDFIDVINSI